MFKEWRKGFVDPNSFEETWKKMKNLDARAISMRAYMINKYELEGFEPYVLSAIQYHIGILIEISDRISGNKLLTW
jgi:hypothetical protein